ncbi:carbohydrate binding family 9 domain-containing protein [Luteimonas suaedae]|uniref:carbohydrate binding family 9 domain-containing protein n=1 Tax=Luteimonas suaedae TaxID=2605430 RepID=UPI001659582F|nr:carbohydrate binding family 9 domain-containing protein [Luteimonas suaedae]
MSITHVDADITVDGHLDEAVWQQATKVELAYETQPGDNTDAAVATTAYIARTDDALLIAFGARDPDPSRIRAFLRDRDSLYHDDYAAIMLDTFDDQRRAYQFLVNPLGVQADRIKEEASGKEDDAWDGLWTSAGRITDDGYRIEMRIPFATLRFRPDDGARRWGVRFLRSRPRENPYLYANQRIERGARCDLCSMRTLDGLAGIRQGRGLEITPTLTVANAQSRANRGWRGEGVQIEPGVDVAWSPSPSLTLNATLNPDFSQVESDTAQLDLNTSFALFFPEKRPFFLEAADTFSTPLQVLYTRQIADPDAGVRVTGRLGSDAYGAVVARDAVTQLLMPGPLGSRFLLLDRPSDVAFARYRHDFDGQTSLGAVTTFRNGDDYRNALAGVDGRWQRGSHTLTGQWLRSDSRYPDELALNDATPAGDALDARYNFSSRNWVVDLQHTRIDPGFRADLGFIPRVGFDQSFGRGVRTWYGAPGAAVTRVWAGSLVDLVHRNDGQLLSRDVRGWIGASGPLQSTARLLGGTRQRFWNGRMFDESFRQLYLEATPWAGVRTELVAQTGRQLDLLASQLGDFTKVDGALWLDIGRGLSVILDGSVQTLERDGGTAFRASVLDARASWQFDPRQRLRLSLQGSAIERDPALYSTPVKRRSRDVAAQLLYSYKLNPRTAGYLGYSHGGYADGDQVRLADRDRSLFLKLSYAWQPGA